MRGIVSPIVLATLSGHSHVTGAELLQLYQSELEAIVERKVARSGARDFVRIEAADL